jgi:hypothetical protein
MLRNFIYNSNSSCIIDALERFGFKLSEKKFPITLLRFEVITPDSFMWRLLIAGSVYYMYAEDYVPGLDYIKNVFSSYLERNEWQFIEPIKKISFESASPVVKATVYQEPDDSEEIMRYAIDSGNDFIFLVKSFEDAGEAQFSDHAPRGFID